MQVQNRINKITFLSPGLGIYTKTTVRGDEWDEIISESSADHHMDTPIHQDMEELVEKLRLHMARLCGLLGRESKETLSVIMTGENSTTHMEILSRIRIKSVTYDLGEDDDKARLQIQGKFVTPFDTRAISIGTPNLHLSSTTYPFAEELQQIILELNAEAFAYARGDKRGGQQTLFAVPVLPIFKQDVVDTAKIVAGVRKEAQETIEEVKRESESKVINARKEKATTGKKTKQSPKEIVVSVEDLPQVETPITDKMPDDVGDDE